MSSLIITKQTGNFFSLVLDGGNPIISEQNRLTTIGNFCNFKTANGANLILKQNILAYNCYRTFLDFIFLNVEF